MRTVCGTVISSKPSGPRVTLVIRVKLGAEYKLRLEDIRIRGPGGSSEKRLPVDAAGRELWWGQGSWLHLLNATGSVRTQNPRQEA